MNRPIRSRACMVSNHVNLKSGQRLSYNMCILAQINIHKSQSLGRLHGKTLRAMRYQSAKGQSKRVNQEAWGNRDPERPKHRPRVLPDVFRKQYGVMRAARKIVQNLGPFEQRSGAIFADKLIGEKGQSMFDFGSFEAIARSNSLRN